jgi:hypothetical protein
MLITFIILFVLASGTAGYFIYRAYYLAGVLSDAQEYIEGLEVTNQYMYSKIYETYDVMKQIDRLGAFESEDEAGTTFQLLNEVITELKEQFDGEEEKEK